MFRFDSVGFIHHDIGLTKFLIIQTILNMYASKRLLSEWFES